MKEELSEFNDFHTALLYLDNIIKDSRFVNLSVRKDGMNLLYEADFLKGLSKLWEKGNDGKKLNKNRSKR